MLKPSGSHSHPSTVFARFFSMLLLCIIFSAHATNLKRAAPNFKLQDQNGQWHELSDYCGQWTVLYFYPRDDTPGCTTQACEFRDEIYAYRKNNIKLIGISLDDVESHQEFASKYSLPFTLLSDSEKTAAKQYGVLKKMGPITFAARDTFIIDPDGNIAQHMKGVKPEGHGQEVLKAISLLSATAGK